jgi:plasmid replication initiation protein
MGNLVVKDNALIEASHKLRESEQCLLLLAIVKGREFCDSIEQLKDKELIIHANDYMEAFGGTRQGAYKALKLAVLGLFEAKWGYRFVNSKGNIEVAYERFTQSAKYVEREATVKFMFANAIIPMLVELERNFTSYELAQVANLKSRYAMRLYEFLIRFKSSKTLKITLDELRFRLGLLDSEYKTMGDFKKFVLDLAVKQINDNTDIKVKYEQHKQGRTITGFTFKFEYRDKPKAKQKQLEQQQRDENTADMFTKLTDKQLARAVHSKKFIADYNGLVSAQNPANQSSGAWVAHMVEWLKKDPATFNKRPMQEYLDDEQAQRF